MSELIEKDANQAQNDAQSSTELSQGPEKEQGDLLGDNQKLMLNEQHPMNWTSGKWRIVAIVSMMSLTTTLASSMFAPVVSQAMAEFNSSSVVDSEMAVSIYVLGFAVGPLVISPLSEIYGRKWAYLISSFLFLVFTIACAVSDSLVMLIAFRFLAGCCGSTPISLGGATIGDMFAKEHRGKAMALWGMTPQLGPAIGPTMGSFLGAARGWRWIFWLLTIITGFILIFSVFVLRETYPPLLYQRRVKASISESGRQSSDAQPLSSLLSQALRRPLTMLFTSPIVFLFSLYVSILFGILYVFITTFPTIFQGQYHFTTGTIGLAYLGLGTGAILGLVFCGKTSDPTYKKLTARNGGVSEPECRLPLLMFTSPLVAIALFAYGWSVETKIHWIVPIIFTALFSAGMMPAFISVNMYLVETFGEYSASALAASKFLQSLFGAFLPLAGRPLFDVLGYGWGNSLLGFIAVAFIPVPWLFFRYGKRLRMSSTVISKLRHNKGDAV